MNAAERIRQRPSKRLQNTDCQFRLVVRKRREMSDFNHQLSIEYNHNHSTKCLQAKTFRDILPETAEKIFTLFTLGHTPALSYRECLKQLKANYKDRTDFQIALADRSIMPSRRDFNNLYTDFKKKTYGSKNIDEMCQMLKTRITEMTANDIEYSFKLNEFSAEEEEPFILAVVTLLMKRVHEKVFIIVSATFLKMIVLHMCNFVSQYNITYHTK